MKSKEVAESSVASLEVVVTSVASDAHTWNLIYLQLLLEELGHQVTNLGACIPDQLMVSECCTRRPDLIAISTVNGHGSSDGKRVVSLLRDCAELQETPIIIGGKLGVADEDNQNHVHELMDAGFNAVFEDSGGVLGFRGFLQALRPRVER